MNEDLDDFWFNERVADELFRQHTSGEHATKSPSDCPWCHTPKESK